MSTVSRYCVLVAALAVAVAGCGKDPVAPPPVPAPVIGINETIIQNATAALAATFANAPQYTFDLSGVQLVTSGAYNDIEVLYTTTNSCDTDVSLFNQGTQQFDQIAFAPPGGTFCFAVFTDWIRLASERFSGVSKYVSNAKQLLLSSGRVPTIRILQLHPDYRAVSTVPDGVFPRGSELVGSTMWMVGNNVFHRYSKAGVKLTDVVTGENYSSMTSDGSSLWAMNDGILTKRSTSGLEQCSFSGSIAGPIAYTNGRLYIASNNQITCINPQTSCQTGVSAIESTIPSPEASPRALATDGTHFYVVGDNSVAKLTLAGGVLATYTTPVNGVVDATYAGGSLWLTHKGPKGSTTRGSYFSEFKLP